MFKPSARMATRTAVRAMRTIARRLRARHPTSLAEDYPRWLAQYHHELPKSVAIDQVGPTFSLILLNPARSTRHLKKLLNSIAAQTYGRWELFVIDLGAKPNTSTHALREMETQFPDRLHWRRNSSPEVAAAGNAALHDARGKFVVFIDPEVVLNINALSEIADALGKEPNADLIYADHDELGAFGRRRKPHLKPAWSPELLQCFNYFGPLLVLRRELAAAIGGIRSDFTGEEIFDLALRLSERTNRIVHLAGVLSHLQINRRSGRPSSDSAKLAVQGHLERLGVSAAVRPCNPESKFENEIFKLDFRFDSFPHVTIVIPTKDRLELLQTCLNSLEQITNYPNYDVVIVDNGSRERATFDYYDRCPHQVISRSLNGRFNFSALVNEGVRAAKGEFALLLNNDIEIVRPDWLRELVGYGRIPGVGAVGAKLLYPDGRIQHAGVIMGHEGLTGHYFQGEPDGLGLKNQVRNVAAVTGACLLTPRVLYESMGGFDEDNLAVAWNDVDYCLRLLRNGLRVVLNPHSVLIHHEGASRGEAKNIDEIQYMMRTWPDFIQSDPYYHPYFSRTGPSFRLRLDPNEDKRYFYRRYSPASREPRELTRNIVGAPC